MRQVQRHTCHESVYIKMYWFVHAAAQWRHTFRLAMLCGCQPASHYGAAAAHRPAASRRRPCCRAKLRSGPPHLPLPPSRPPPFLRRGATSQKGRRSMPVPASKPDHAGHYAKVVPEAAQVQDNRQTSEQRPYQALPAPQRLGRTPGAPPQGPLTLQGGRRPAPGLP